MDTKLKKFKLSSFFKIIAVILCIASVAVSVSQMVSVSLKASENDLTEEHIFDAVTYDPQKTEIWTTESFRDTVISYFTLLSDMHGEFGDGSEEAYKRWQENIESYNKPVLEKSKENLVKFVQSDTLSYLQALYDGVIISLGRVESIDYIDSEVFYSTYEVEKELEYYEIADEHFAYVQDFDILPELKKKLTEIGADGVVRIRKYTEVYDYDVDETRQAYQPGCYAFKIDEQQLTARLMEHDILKHNRFESYKDFSNSYERYRSSCEKYYKSGRYFITDKAGNTYTNMTELSEKSDEKAVKAAFGKLGFYCASGIDGSTYLPDGSYYGHFSIDENDMWSNGYYYGDGSVVVTTVPPVVYIESTTVIPTIPEAVNVSEATTSVELTAPSVNNMTTSFHYVPSDDITTAPATTRYNGNFDSTPFIVNGDGDAICYVGVDLTSPDVSEDDRFMGISSKIHLAKLLLKDTLITCSIMLVQFIVCLIYLVIRSGRRHGDKENVYLLGTDRIFVDWRIVINGLAGFGIIIAMFWIIDMFSENEAILVRALASLGAIFTAVVLDLVLFLTRHIKNKSFFRNLFVVWLIRKAHSLYKTKLGPFIDEKLLYTKSFKRNTIIKSVIIISVNLMGIFFGLLEFAHNDTLVIAVLLGLLDAVMLVCFFRFIGSVNKILSVIEEIKNGNYDVQINLNSLTSGLHEDAKRLMGLRDGLKSAVSEAVRQEQTKTELITNVSHDLKTPLTSVINYVELLKRCNIEDETAKEYLDVLGEKSDRLKKLIEDLVEASKASTGNLKTEIVDVSLNEIISQIIGEYSDVLGERGLSLITAFPEENIVVKADSRLLYRVLENLMGNVSKYAMENTRVYVNIEKRGTAGVISVKNISGSPLNITAEQLKARFVRGDESRSTEGSGLGLSIAESLCTIQGGRLNLIINGDLFVAEVEMNIK